MKEGVTATHFEKDSSAFTNVSGKTHLVLCVTLVSEELLSVNVAFNNIDVY